MQYELFQPVYSLCLLNANMPSLKEFKDEHIHNFIIHHEHHTDVIIPGMHFVFVELMKFKSSNRAHNHLAGLWLKFLTFVENKKNVNVPKELNSDPNVKSALHYLKRMHLNEKERRAYDKYWDTISYERSLISGKLAEGRSEEKKASIAVMLDDGLNIETIAKYSRISIEEAQKIIDEIEKEKKDKSEKKE